MEEQILGLGSVRLLSLCSQSLYQLPQYYNYQEYSNRNANNPLCMYIATWMMKYFYLHLVLDPHNYLLTQTGEVMNVALQKKQDLERITTLTRSCAQQVTGRAKTRSHVFRLLVQCSLSTLVHSASTWLHEVILLSAMSLMSKTVPDT